MVAQTKVVRLTPQQVLEFWKDIEPALKKALDHSIGETDVFTWFKRLMNPERAQLWVVMDENRRPLNVSLTQLLRYDQFTTLHIVLSTSLGTARWNDYRESHHVLEEFARYHNCRSIEMWGRKGWERMLPKLKGKHEERYKKVYSVMHMDLE